VAEQITFEVVATTFAADVESRTLTGILLPFGAVSRPAKDRATGKASLFSFAEGSVVVPNAAEVPIVLNYGHDGESLNAQVGIATDLEAKADGVHAKFRIARTPEGDRVLALAEDRILRSFSAEVEGEFSDADADGVRHAKATTLTGAAVVPKPAFTGAAITSVAASAAQIKEINMKCTTCGLVHAEGVSECTSTTFSAAQGTALMGEVQALTEKIAELEKIKIPVGPGSAQFQVTEEPIYRFAGTEPAPSGFDFATDLLAAGKDGDQAALARLAKFTAETPEFANQPTTTGDTAAVNPSQYRPDMFLGQAPTPQSPLYDAFYKGALANVTPFFWSKLDRTNTDIGVGDHTEDVDPETRDLVTAAGATVTPVPVSGKVHITREVADQGGNPVVSGLIKAEFDRSFAIAKETKTAALIQAAAAGVTALCTIAPGAAGDVAGKAIEAGLIGVQFLADGARFTKAFGHVDLYTALAAFENADGEKRYPIINPQNRAGISGSKYSFLDIAGYRMEPTASLGATSVNASNSWLADPNAVHVWASGLTRLDKLEETVAGWNVGVFAYFAGVVYDVSGLRKIAYDPAP
jgi:hypothetical protein